MKATFKQQKALIANRGFLCDYESSCGPSFEALLPVRGWQGHGAELLVVEGEGSHLVGAGTGHREPLELVMLDQSGYRQQSLACQEKTLTV